MMFRFTSSIGSWLSLGASGPVLRLIGLHELLHPLHLVIPVSHHRRLGFRSHSTQCATERSCNLIRQRVRGAAMATVGCKATDGTAFLARR